MEREPHEEFSNNVHQCKILSRNRPMLPYQRMKAFKKVSSLTEIKGWQTNNGKLPSDFLIKSTES